MESILSPRTARGAVALSVWMAVVAVAAAPVPVAAQDADAAKPNYELAARWTSGKVGKIVFDTSVTPHWAETSDRFWYSFETPAGKRFMLVDPVRKSRKPVFDHAKMAAMLSEITRTPYDAQHLPIKALKFVDKDAAVRFEIEVPADAFVAPPGKGGVVATASALTTAGEKEENGQRQNGQQADKDDESKEKKKTLTFDYDLTSGQLVLREGTKAEPKKPRWVSVSPDGRTAIFARGHNLYRMDAAGYAKALEDAKDASIAETQLTTDGEEHFSYARRLNEEDRKEFTKGAKEGEQPRVPAIPIYWSRDSSKISVVRADQRKVADLWVINSLADPRPTIETYRYAMPGEEHVPQYELAVIEIATKGKVVIKADRFKDQSISVQTAAQTARAADLDRTEPQWLSDTADKLYFTRLSRDMRRLDVLVADVSTGETKTLIEERLNVYIDSKPLRLLGNGKEILHWSERDGWGHYYLYDEGGRLIRQVTSGEFSTVDIEGIDEKARTIFVTAAGKEAGEDPYYLHLYRVGLDAGGMTLVNGGGGSHSTAMPDSARFIVDTASRVDTAPNSVLRDTAGNVLMELETTDVSALESAGFRFPEPFTVKADDGVTDLYGVLYKPFDFDPARKYPIIAFVYPGPQTESVTKTFSPRSANIALAQFGFIVVEVGNRGGHPQRSKWYHTYGYGNLRDYGLADKKAAIEQLARRHPFIDIARVGIYGHSGGGFMSTAAMLVYPDFFKVAVASSGNHDNNVYNKNWSEKHHGVKEVVDKDGKVKFEYDIEKNSELAKNLKGRLLLVTGDRDDNVHMANTLRMADALIKANKRFDFFVFPGKRHGYADAGDYFFWLRADYFCRNLLGSSPVDVDIAELNREKEQVGNKRPGR